MGKPVFPSVQPMGRPSLDCQKHLAPLTLDQQAAVLEKYLLTMGYNRAEAQFKIREGQNRNIYWNQKFPEAELLKKIESILQAGEDSLNLLPLASPFIPYIENHFRTTSWVTPLIESAVRVEGKDFDNLIRWAPLWFEASDAGKFCESLIRKGDNLRLGNILAWCLMNRPSQEHSGLVAQFRERMESEIHAHSPLRHAQAFRARDTYETFVYLQLLSHLSLADVRSIYGSQLQPFWLEQLVSPDTKIESLDVHTIWLNKFSAGSCKWKFHYHMASLGLLATYEAPSKPILISINGTLIGSLKFESDPSFLAFRNVQDENGHLVLVEGGVYMLSRTQAFALLDAQLPNDVIIDVPSLNVAPIDLLTNLTIERNQEEDLFYVFGEYISLPELTSLRARSSDDPKRARLWNILLSQLRQKRDELERKLPRQALNPVEW